jgi:hypothetical protein
MASAGGSSHGNVGYAPGDPIGENDPTNPRYPLWKHVKIIQSNGPNGGNTKSECLFCEKIISGSYTRVRAHLLKIPRQCVSICRKVTVPILEQLHREVAEAEPLVNGRQPNNIPLLWQNQPELYRLKYASPHRRATSHFKRYKTIGLSGRYLTRR